MYSDYLQIMADKLSNGYFVFKNIACKKVK